MALTNLCNVDCNRFIQDVKAHPAIWMANHPHRKNKILIQKHWNDIGKKYPEHTVDDLKKRWKNLKDAYRKELKRQPQARPGVPAENVSSCWRYFDSLYFLKDELVFLTKEQDETCSKEIDPPKYLEAVSHSSETTESSNSDDEMSQRAESLKRKEPEDMRVEILKLERKKIKILEEEVAKTSAYVKSDNYHFLMSLLPEMDKLGPLQKMRLRTKISQAVLDEVSSTIYNKQQSYNEVQPKETISFIEQPESDSNIKEEAIINMYD